MEKLYYYETHCGKLGKIIAKNDVHAVYLVMKIVIEDQLSDIVYVWEKQEDGNLICIFSNKGI